MTVQDYRQLFTNDFSIPVSKQDRVLLSELNIAQAFVYIGNSHVLLVRAKLEKVLQVKAISLEELSDDMSFIAKHLAMETEIKINDIVGLTIDITESILPAFIPNHPNYEAYKKHFLAQVGEKVNKIDVYA